MDNVNRQLDVAKVVLVIHCKKRSTTSKLIALLEVELFFTETETRPRGIVGVYICWSYKATPYSRTCGACVPHALHNISTLVSRCILHIVSLSSRTFSAEWGVIEATTLAGHCSRQQVELYRDGNGRDSLAVSVSLLIVLYKWWKEVHM